MLSDTMLMTAQVMQDDRLRGAAAAMLLAEVDAEPGAMVAARRCCGRLLVSLGERMMASRAATVTPWRAANVSR